MINNALRVDPGYLCLHHKTIKANRHLYIECTSVRVGILNTTIKAWNGLRKNLLWHCFTHKKWTEYKAIRTYAIYIYIHIYIYNTKFSKYKTIINSILLINECNIIFCVSLSNRQPSLELKWWYKILPHAVEHHPTPYNRYRTLINLDDPQA